MPNLDIIYDVKIAVTWDEINTDKWVIYQPTCLPGFVTFTIPTLTLLTLLLH